MRKTFGILTIVAGVALALYVGIVVMFVGGIEQIVQGVDAEPTEASDIAWGIVRVLSATFVGGCIFWFSIALGVALIESSPYHGKNRPTAKQVERTWKDVLSGD